MDINQDIDRVARRMTEAPSPPLQSIVLDRLDEPRERLPAGRRVLVVAGVVLCLGPAYWWLRVPQAVPRNSVNGTVPTTLLQAPLTDSPSVEVPASESEATAREGRILSRSAPVVVAPLWSVGSGASVSGVVLPSLSPVLPIAVTEIQPAPLAPPLIDVMPMEIAPLLVSPLPHGTGG